MAQKESSADYILTRDYVDNNRINLHHYQFTSLFGYLVHPSIPIRDEPDYRIADVGTGTGIWLTDLSTKLSKAKLDGLDVTLRPTPPKKWCPENVSFSEWDIRTEPPAELIGQYDLVHIRFLICVLRNNEIEAAIPRILKLLKPGGYLQWGEVDMLTYHIETVGPEVSAPGHQLLKETTLALDPRITPSWPPRLPEFFGAEAVGGMSDVVSDVRDAPPHLALQIHEGQLPIHETLIKATKNEKIRGRTNEILPMVCDETREGAMFACTRSVTVGRKPL